MDNDIKKIEQEAERRGYARGYAAGKRKKKQEDQDKAFLDRAFLVALPACITAQGYKRGDKPINSMLERTDLAWYFAKAALRMRRANNGG